MRQLIVAIGAIGALAACAQPGAPPGGPPDPAPPRLIGVTPDSGAINARPDRVVFQFDEVVDERSGGASLSRLFLISPVDGEVDVDWRRRALAIRPTRGRWRPNTVYTVTMLPGLRDLRGNTLSEGTSLVFSTGPIIPETEITGVAFDWPAGRVLPAAFVEAIARPDSTIYLTRADSSGRFTFRHLWPGIYTLRAFGDANQNRTADPRESWDSVQVSLTDTVRAELYAFVHDSVGPGIANIVVADSITVRVTLDRPLDTAQELEPSRFAVLAPDSTPVPVAEVLTAAAWTARERARTDSAAAAAAAQRADTLPRRPAPSPAARADTGQRAAPPQLSRPVPVTEIVLRLAQPLSPDTPYRLRTAGLRNLIGIERDVERTFRTPAVRAPADSVPRVPPPTPPPEERS